ncbi:CsbD family protein [Pelomonas sp. HMWF004]|nr:CsbD family protein [Pelomonas sp. HMWF004]
MNKDQIKGSVKDAAGKAQRKLGEAIGSTDQQVKGAVTQVEGKAQKAVGDAREALKDAGDAARKI